MFGNKTLFLSLLTALTLTGCANPKYVQESDDQNGKQGAQESKTECGIQFSSSGTCLVWSWEKKPTSVTDTGSLIFKTYRLNSWDQTPVEADLNPEPQVILWMPSMGHGSTPTQTTRLDVGTYRASNVLFVMPGEWDIHFQIKNGTEIVDEAQVSIKINF